MQRLRFLSSWASLWALALSFACILVSSQVTLARKWGHTNYAVSVSASPTSGGAVSGAGTFSAGSRQSVSATANSGYRFLHWIQNGGVVSTSASYTFTINGNVSLVADFTPLYSIAVSASPSGGGTVAGAGTFAGGSTQTVTATANNGYAFISWTQNGNVVSTSASYSFTLNGNVILLANFAPTYSVSVSASPSAGGMVIGSGTFVAGSAQKVTATANGGYSFVNWTQNGTVVSTSTSYMFNLTSNVTLVANFASTATQYSVTVSASPSTGGTVVGGGTFAAGSTRTVTATANNGYAFVNWTQNGAAVSASPAYTFALNANVALVANFSSGNASFPWNPGMMSKGGIPTRATVCATLSPGNGTTDDSARIQTALDSCPAGQIVQLNAGTFVVNNLLLVHSSITLRGAGAGSTFLKKTNGARGRTTTVVSGTTGILTPVAPSSYAYDTQPVVIVGPCRWPGVDNSTSQNLSVDGAQAASSVTIANASGFAAGQFVLLDEKSGASWRSTPTGFPGGSQVWAGDHVAWNMHFPVSPGDDNGNSNASGPYDSTPGTPPAAMSWFSRTDRPTTEIKEIASVSGNTITFTSPLTIGYRVSHAAQLTRYTLTGSQAKCNSVHVTNAGVESLTISGGADGALRFEAAAYSWAKNVEVTQWIGEGVAINNSFRIEVRDSYIHTGSWPEPGGAGYIISFADASSEALIENNILIDACKEMVFRSSGAGSVVAYNYADNSWDFDTPTWVEVGLNASHMAGPHHVLFEGNYSQNFDSDYTHGNAIYLTVFRNWLSGQRRSFTDGGNIRTVGLAYGSWWDTFIGNVLGRPGQMSGWHYTDPAMSCDTNGNNCTGNNSVWISSDIWQLGYDPERWGMNPDPQTLSTVIRDGNYDYLTNSQRWHTTPGGFVIPNSLYLKSKPAFFGSNPWPWVDPATGATYTLPAKARYEAGTPLCGC